jgi:hypothetical protein
VNVATDAGGPMFIFFASPIVSFSGYFTYATQLTLQGYDDLGNPGSPTGKAPKRRYSNIGTRMT